MHTWDIVAPVNQSLAEVCPQNYWPGRQRDRSQLWFWTKLYPGCTLPLTWLGSWETNWSVKIPTKWSANSNNTSKYPCCQTFRIGTRNAVGHVQLIDSQRQNIQSHANYLKSNFSFWAHSCWLRVFKCNGKLYIVYLYKLAKIVDVSSLGHWVNSIWYIQEAFSCPLTQEVRVQKTNSQQLHWVALVCDQVGVFLYFFVRALVEAWIGRVSVIDFAENG